jgi:small subunit ribosomal protein S18
MSEDNKKFESNDRDSKSSSANLIGKPYFRRKKSCPFTGPRAPDIDYKDTRTLTRFVSPYGKMLPSHITGVSNIKQRELAIAVKRARHLALMPYTAR